MPDPLLDVSDLHVRFKTDDGIVRAVDGVSFSIMPGETLGVVGESGSGKSVSSLAIMGLVNRKQADVTGSITFKGQDLLTLPNDEMRDIRGKQISMIFQDPMTSLHPFYRVGDQISESILEHEDDLQEGRRASGRSRCWASWASLALISVLGSIRTSSRAACGSGP